MSPVSVSLVTLAFSGAEVCFRLPGVGDPVPAGWAGILRPRIGLLVRAKTSQGGRSMPDSERRTRHGAGPAVRLRVGERSYDIAHRALVMGILNRTTDSFYDRAACFPLNDLLPRAQLLVAHGAHLLDLRSRAAGLATRELSEV